MFLLIRILHPLVKQHMTDFNTSHVSINRGCREKRTGATVISIHLMFLLIVPFTAEPFPPSYFNTSHVSINPHTIQEADSLHHISIHLMFLLIPAHQTFSFCHHSFQYISCFY